VTLASFAWPQATVGLVVIAPLTARWLCAETTGWRDPSEARRMIRIFATVGVLVAALAVLFASWGAQVWDIVGMGAAVLFCAVVVATLRPYATSSR
jgi:hypothetical protein